MKTLSERNEEIRAQKQRDEERYLLACKTLLYQVKEAEIPLHNPEGRETNGSFQGHFDMISQRRDRLRNQLAGLDENGKPFRFHRGRRPELLDVACDHCRTQLINPQPGMQTLSSPPQIHVACVGCGWKGYMRK